MHAHNFTTLTQHIYLVMTFPLTFVLQDTGFEFLLTLMTKLKIAGGLVGIELSRK